MALMTYEVFYGVNSKEKKSIACSEDSESEHDEVKVGCDNADTFFFGGWSNNLE